MSDDLTENVYCERMQSWHSSVIQSAHLQSAHRKGSGQSGASKFLLDKNEQNAMSDMKRRYGKDDNILY